MTTKNEIMTLAEQQFSKVWVRMNIDYLEAFFNAAQRQAYERAAEVCETECGEYFDGYEFQQPNNHDCAAAIRALIEGDGK